MKTFGKVKHLAAGTPQWQSPDSWAIAATPDVTIRLKRMFPRVDRYRSGALLMRDTPEVCRDLEWVMERWPMLMEEADRELLLARSEKHQASEQAVLDILSGHRPPFEGLMEPARKPRDYQLVAADVALTTGRLLLTDDLGLGKSFSGLLLLRDPKALPALIVTLTHLPPQWLGELAKSFPLLRGHILRKGTPYDFRKVRELRGHEPDVIITNYAKLAGWADHLAGKVNTVIFDEVQELRRIGSLKYTAAAQVADGCRYRMGMTATPVYNYGGEIHSIISVLDNDALGSRDEFTREWGYASQNGHIVIDNPRALGSFLYDSGLMLRRTRKDVGRELPEVVRVPHAVEADEKKLEKLSAGVVDLAELIVSRSGTRQEVWKASGDLDVRLRHATGVAKAPYVAEFVRMLLEAEERVVLFGWHHDVYDYWRRDLAVYKPAFYTGKESPHQKRLAEQAFLSGDSRVMIMSLRAGAGLDGLQGVCHVIVFGELDWSPGMHEQCIGRLNRDGQDEPVVAYFMVAETGSDPVIAEVLNLKRQQSEPIRDPAGNVLEPAADTTDRVRRLAEQVMAKRRARAGNQTVMEVPA